MGSMIVFVLKMLVLLFQEPFQNIDLFDSIIGSRWYKIHRKKIFGIMIFDNI